MYPEQDVTHMSISIQTNVSSLMAQENLRVNNDFSNQTIQRLTSGFRINASGDDAAGLVIANTFRSRVAELTQGVRNANDGLSTLQIIDGGLNNIAKILDRLKTLATESATETLVGGDTTRATLQAEFSTLLLEIDRQAGNVGLGAGASGTDPEALYKTAIGVYIGGGSDAAASVVTVDLSAAGVDSTTLAINASTVATLAGATAALVSIDAAVGTLGDAQGAVGAGQNDLHYAIQLAQSQIANFSAAESRIRDADVAAEAANLTKAQVLQQASLAAMAQANSAPQAVLALLRQ
jgi:flagellin